MKGRCGMRTVGGLLKAMWLKKKNLKSNGIIFFVYAHIRACVGMNCHRAL